MLTELYVKNKVIQTNTLAIRVRKYAFIIKKMNTKVWKLIACHRMHPPRTY